MFKASRAEDLSSAILPSTLPSTIYSYRMSASRQKTHASPFFGRRALNHAASFQKAPCPHRTISWIPGLTAEYRAHSLGKQLATQRWKTCLRQAFFPVSLKGKGRNTFGLQPARSTIDPFIPFPASWEGKKRAPFLSSPTCMIYPASVLAPPDFG